MPSHLPKTPPLTALLLAASLATLASACDGSSAPTGPGLPGSAIAIVNSDYSASTVSLYDPKSKKLVDHCLTVNALSKDVALPSGTQGGELVVIDRDRSLIDFVDASNCHVRAQLSVSTGGFKANPHDVVHVSDSKAYVVRYEKNAAATAAADDFDDGDDLLIINPSEPAVTGRIDMGSHASTVAGATLQARPDHAVLANGLVYVSLNNLAGDFSVAGPGRLAIVDPATDTVTDVFDLPEQTGCSGLAYDDATKRLYVSCGGEFSDADQAAKSALVVLDVSGATPAIVKTIGGKSLGTQPMSYNPAAYLGDTAFAGTAGALDFATGDQLAPDAQYTIDVTTGAGTKLIDGGAYNLGRATVDPTSKTLFLPDGDPVAPKIRVFDVSAAPVAGDPFESNPGEHLPPREAAWY